MATQQISWKGPTRTRADDCCGFETHEVLKNWEIKQRIAQSQPYGEWHSNANMNRKLPPSQTDRQALLRHQIAFGYNTEDVEMVSRWQERGGGDFRYGG